MGVTKAFPSSGIVSDIFKNCNSFLVIRVENINCHCFGLLLQKCSVPSGLLSDDRS